MSATVDGVQDMSNKGGQLKPVEFDPFYLSFIEAIFGESTLKRARVYECLAEQYGAFIVSAVAKHNKVGRNSREIVQELHAQFNKSNLVEKFFQQARLSMADTITGEQAARVLGVSWDRFRVAHRRANGRCKYRKATDGLSRLPRPIEGSDQSKKALYRTAEIIAFSADPTYFRKETMGESDISSVVPKPTRKHFQHYLNRCIHHRFANYCRTEDRHNKERLHDAFPEFRPPVDDPSPWESRLVATGGASYEQRAELALFIRKIEESPAAPFKDDLFNLLVEGGCDIEQAIDRLEMSAEDKRQTKRICGPWISMVQEARANRAERRSRPTLPPDGGDSVAA